MDADADDAVQRLKLWGANLMFYHMNYVENLLICMLTCIVHSTKFSVRSDY